MNKKNVLAIEGNTMIDAAKTAYQMDTLDGLIGENAAYCYSLASLVDNGYFDKNGDDYNGSVQITPNGDNGYTYKFWISNKSYSFNGNKDQITNSPGVSEGATGKDADTSYKKASDNCGKAEQSS